MIKKNKNKIFFVAITLFFLGVSPHAIFAGCTTYYPTGLYCPTVNQQCQFCTPTGGCQNVDAWCADCGGGKICVSCSASWPDTACDIVCIGPSPQCVPRRGGCTHPCGSCIPCTCGGGRVSRNEDKAPLVFGNHQSLTNPLLGKAINGVSVDFSNAKEVKKNVSETPNPFLASLQFFGDFFKNFLNWVNNLISEIKGERADLFFGRK